MEGPIDKITTAYHSLISAPAFRVLAKLSTVYSP